jgi:pimeloyl-ACP methyl ester carboxylesterase
VELELELHSTRLAPLQRRLIPLRIVQHATFPPSVKTLLLTFLFESDTPASGQVKLMHKSDWSLDPNPHLVLRQTHRFPTLADSILLPPIIGLDQRDSTRPLLALHGAGVQVDSAFWTSALKRRERNWVVLARGLTPWGYDWHGPSALDALAALNTLRQRELGVAPTAVVIGHSNGGQGALHLGAHFPDVFGGTIPVAAYLTSATYVPTVLSHGMHFAEPTLRGILSASLAGGDNDFFLGNLASRHTRIFHGGDDENVPVWNSRKVFDIIRTYDYSANAL